MILCLPLAGCKAILNFSLQKDWSVDSHPLDSGIYQPDLKTSIDLNFERDFGN